jgi:hypothetical protein
MCLHWAIHRLNGVSSPGNVAYSVDELQHQLKSAGASCLFTTLSLLSVSLPAAEAVGIPKNRIYVCEMPGDDKSHAEFKRLSELITEGELLTELESIQWTKRQGKKQIAFLYFSSCTAGLPVSLSPLPKKVILTST